MELEGKERARRWREGGGERREGERAGERKGGSERGRGEREGERERERVGGREQHLEGDNGEGKGPRQPHLCVRLAPHLDQRLQLAERAGGGKDS